MIIINSKIYSLVNTLKKEYNTTNPFRLCHELDAIIVEYPLINVNGFYQRYENQDIIYINQNLTDEEKILVCAHELGHMLLHNDLNIIMLDTSLEVGGKYELEANAFAVQLLQDHLNLSAQLPLIDWSSDNSAIRRRVLFSSDNLVKP